MAEGLLFAILGMGAEHPALDAKLAAMHQRSERINITIANMGALPAARALAHARTSFAEGQVCMPACARIHIFRFCQPQLEQPQPLVGKPLLEPRQALRRRWRQSAALSCHPADAKPAFGGPLGPHGTPCEMTSACGLRLSDQVKEDQPSRQVPRAEPAFSSTRPTTLCRR